MTNQTVSPVGYQLHAARGRLGPRGPAYNYVMAGNGLGLEAENDHIDARVLLAEADVRGLATLSYKFTLKHGRVPVHIWDEILDLLTFTTNETYGAVRWHSLHGHGEYTVEMPTQRGTPAAVRFEPVQDAVLDVHTHPGMGAFFIGTDDQDEQGFRLYGVLGLDTGRPAVRLRLGIYGYFVDVAWGEVFQGDIGEWHDMVAQALREGG